MRVPERPVFSVVIPVYNCAAYVGHAIRSALNQTIGRSSVEVIVLDDGSTDETPAVVSGFGRAVRFVQCDHGGVSKARNAGIERATGTYVAFLDADDYWFPQRLERAVSLMQSRTDIFVNSDFYVEVAGRRNPRPYYETRGLRCLFSLDARAQFEFAIEDNFINCMAIVPRQMLLAQEGFNTRLRYGEDWDLWLRLLDAGHPVRLIPQPSAVYRYHRPGATTTRHDLGMAADRLRILSQYPECVSPYRMQKAKSIERTLRFRKVLSRLMPRYLG